MIYTSERGIRTILIVFLLCFAVFVIYFLNEVKKIEIIYDNIYMETINEF